MGLRVVQIANKIFDMRKVPVRKLQQQLRRVLELVQRGETVEVTKRNKVVAWLSPAQVAPMPAPWPDLDARARRIFGKRVLSPGASEEVLKNRGSW